VADSNEAITEPQLSRFMLISIDFLALRIHNFDSSIEILKIIIALLWLIFIICNGLLRVYGLLTGIVWFGL
jgi:hypothetical protein